MQGFLGSAQIIQCINLHTEAPLYVQSNQIQLVRDDIEGILTDDFIGRNEKSRFTWTKENHQNFWTENKGAAQDSIYRQMAQGNWVATMFMRKMNWKGRDIEAESMHFKRFEDGKIAEMFEFGDSKQRE